ncbi:hypothetical protein CONPUDRAFT_72363 [Coniophora puteana RWD-64-598 SS2]|uniref:Uncharacterized protein n=1 Tax=Coniophora puteana (strain RWD-64-598) TaxID=741705 RepID=A0A5M3MS98_CONPW|nr:uncharacterized protein CONPUDRAFT_72363 [Coniophora puteana RWD-64-598 SS2]EIW82028.1 hypothetical protein CONPUDRAFT_72363 [Coniophora puteana RWD-64-598 SS2]
MANRQRTSTRLKSQGVKALTTTITSPTVDNTSSNTESSAQAPPDPANHKHPCELSVTQTGAAPAHSAPKPKSKLCKHQGTRTVEQLAANTAAVVTAECAPGPADKCSPGLAAECSSAPLAVPAWCTLPDCKRQEHPGKPNVPRRKRTSKEVQAHEEERRQLLERLQQLSKRQAAEITDEEELDEVRELKDKTEVVLTWEQQLNAAMNAPPSDHDTDISTGYGQTLGREPVYLDGDNEKPAYYIRTMPGVTPMDDNTSVGASVSIEAKVVSKKGKAPQRNTSKTTENKAAKAPMFALGLKLGWRTHAASSSNTSHEHAPAIGGLNDDDTGGAHPGSRKAKALTKQGQLPCNDADASMALKKQTPGSVKLASKTKARRSCSILAKTSAAPIVKTEPITETVPVIKSKPGVVAPSPAALMPAFDINNYWTTSLLPTIHTCFASFDNMWNIFKRSPETATSGKGENLVGTVHSSASKLWCDMTWANQLRKSYHTDPQLTSVCIGADMKNSAVVEIEMIIFVRVEAVLKLSLFRQKGG